MSCVLSNLYTPTSVLTTPKDYINGRDARLTLILRDVLEHVAIPRMLVHMDVPLIRLTRINMAILRSAWQVGGYLESLISVPDRLEQVREELRAKGFDCTLGLLASSAYLEKQLSFELRRGGNIQRCLLVVSFHVVNAATPPASISSDVDAVYAYVPDKPDWAADFMRQTENVVFGPWRSKPNKRCAVVTFHSKFVSPLSLKFPPSF